MNLSANKALKMAMITAGVTQQEMAVRMGITHKTFKNKINHRKINGCEARFSKVEKAFLWMQTGVDITEIE